MIVKGATPRQFLELALVENIQRADVLTAIIHETTGINPRDFAEESLFKPLGISGVAWIADPDGIPLGAGGFKLTPRDMAKLGYLYLRNGQWDGQQIVSSDWIEKSTQTYWVVNEHLVCLSLDHHT